MAEPQGPSANFYKFMALVCLVVSVWLIVVAVVQHAWVYGALAIITVGNGIKAWRKRLPPRETNGP